MENKVILLLLFECIVDIFINNMALLKSSTIFKEFCYCCLGVLLFIFNYFSNIKKLFFEDGLFNLLVLYKKIIYLFVGLIFNL